MRVAGLDSSGDWQFGSGKASYLVRSNAALQSLMTRLKSFANDWFLDVDANIDWIALLGSRNAERQIKNSVERVTLETDGIARIDLFEVIVNRTERRATIRMQVTTIFDDAFEINVPVSVTPTPPVTGSLLLEDGGYLLLETGGQLLL